ncbi:MAG: hypothetical protein ACREOW_05115 [Thermodesulfobacteriota bacterium]
MNPIPDREEDYGVLWNLQESIPRATPVNDSGRVADASFPTLSFDRLTPVLLLFSIFTFLILHKLVR